MSGSLKFLQLSAYRQLRLAAERLHPHVREVAE